MSKQAKTKVAVVGASGFTGEKLVELLLKHPRIEVTYLSAKLDKESNFSDLFPKFKGRLDLISMRSISNALFLHAQASIVKIS